MPTGHQVSFIPADENPVSPAARILTKSVHALAIEPLNMALTVTGRKAYNVMLYISQHSSPDPEGWYSSPVSAILRGYGSTTKASERLQRYIEQMVTTAVVWRPLAASEQGMLFAPDSDIDPDAPDALPANARTRLADDDEARTFPLLAEARLSRRNGEAWVKWVYPPSIKEQLIHPDRYAQVELQSIALLTTYTSVALYEICARFKTSPGALTNRASPDFWCRVLREGGDIKPREWRKVKNELVVPAIAEINEVSEINIELIEHRPGNAVVAVQFRVTKKPRDRDRAKGPTDVAQVLRAARLEIREADFDALITKYGAFKVAEALDALESYVNDPTATKIVNKTAYLRTILANRYPDNQAEILTPQEAASAAPVQQAIDGDSREDLVKKWVAGRFKQLNAEFGQLSEDERARWIDATATRFTTPAVKRRLDNRDWVSPLVNHLVLDAFAIGTYGSGWKTPTEMDLTMFKVAEARRS
ncbi:replication initiation protein [Variovorax saccharolyticus]|nr:replication initiation protein [Variovorax sp. J22R187]MDM0022266.1 replication initiation protein [Variovorax sp. J22R187]